VKCHQDEIFGAALSILRVKTYDEAIKLCCDNRRGNGRQSSREMAPPLRSIIWISMPEWSASM